jgi:hypothetical protein
VTSLEVRNPRVQDRVSSLETEALFLLLGGPGN